MRIMIDLLQMGVDEYIRVSGVPTRFLIVV